MYQLHHTFTIQSTKHLVYNLIRKLKNGIHKRGGAIVLWVLLVKPSRFYLNISREVFTSLHPRLVVDVKI